MPFENTQTRVAGEFPGTPPVTVADALPVPTSGNPLFATVSTKDLSRILIAAGAVSFVSSRAQMAQAYLDYVTTLKNNAANSAFTTWLAANQH
jgi:hypothetical protein